MKKILKLPNNKELIIKLDEEFQENELVEIMVIYKNQADYQNKIEQLKSAVHDPAFIDDLYKTSNDFNYIDAEGLD